jgi:hypothetical protein
MFRNIAATRRRGLIAAAAATTALACGIGAAAGAGVQINPFGTSHVGTQADGSVLRPSSQRIAPFGQRTKLTSEAAGHAISPDGTKVAVQAGRIASGARPGPAQPVRLLRRDQPVKAVSPRQEDPRSGRGARTKRVRRPLRRVTS